MGKTEGTYERFRGGGLSEFLVESIARVRVVAVVNRRCGVDGKGSKGRGQGEEWCALKSLEAGSAVLLGCGEGVNLVVGRIETGDEELEERCGGMGVSWSRGERPNFIGI